MQRDGRVSGSTSDLLAAFLLFRVAAEWFLLANSGV